MFLQQAGQKERHERSREAEQRSERRNYARLWKELVSFMKADVFNVQMENT